jgi:hypothetical protein
VRAIVLSRLIRRPLPLLAVVLLSACSSEVGEVPEDEGSTVSIEGTYLTSGYDLVGDGCTVYGSQQVKVLDGEGSLLATGELVDGKTKSTSDSYLGNRCELHFRVRNIPETDFYVLELDGGQSDAYTQSDLNSLGWSLQLGE